MKPAAPARGCPAHPVCGDRTWGAPGTIHGACGEPVSSWEDVRRIALALPEAEEKPLHGLAAWRIRERLFVWERPLRKSDLAALGDQAPRGAILGARVEHLGAKEALLADSPGVYFTIPHFDGYAAVLVRLERIDVAELHELIVEAWLTRAPKRLAAAYVARHLTDGTE